MNTIAGVIVFGVILLPYFLVYNNLINDSNNLICRNVIP